MKHQNSKKEIVKSKKRGYTLLFAVLTAALVLGVAVFILNISTKQYALSASARDSMYSFYAADSGIECAASDSNWVPVGSSFSSTSASNELSCDGQLVTFPTPTAPSITISGIEDDPNNSSNPARQSTVIIGLPYNVNGIPVNECTSITFTTGWSQSLSQPVTLIDSRGYNFCNNSGGIWSLDTSNPNLLERALRLTEVGVW